MSLNTVKIQLAASAEKNGICKPWLNQLLKAPDFSALLEMYIKGIDFCFSNNFPSNFFIRKHFKGKMESHHIYLDETIDLHNTKEVVCLGDTRLHYLADDYTISQLFIKDKCKVRVVARGFASVTLDIFDEVELLIDASEDAKVLVNNYIGAKVEFSSINNSKVNVIHKTSKTYVNG